MKPKRKLTEIVDEIIRKRVASGRQFSTKQVKDDARAAYDRGEVIDDLVDAAIDRAVERRDKASHQNDADDLGFEEFCFPETLVIADKERQPTRTAKLEHVLADQAIKQANKINQDRAFLKVQQRNLLALPYLQAGMTVEEAVRRLRGES